MSAPTAATHSPAADAGEQRPRGPFERVVAWLCVLGGAAGLVSAFALTLEKIATISNPGYQPSCDLNPIISCGSVMQSWQGSTFGFPNPLIGLTAYGALITIGVALLAGFRPPRWFWVGLQVGTGLGLLFVFWLIYSSLYSIYALCPYCMVVWVATIVVFWYVTMHNLERGHLGVTGPVAQGLARFHSLGLAVFFLVIIALILQAFWMFWSTLL